MPAVPISDLDLVRGVLSDAEGFPAEGHTQAARGMLVAGLPNALPRTPGAQTHQLQGRFVELMEAMLTEARLAAVAATEEASGQVLEAGERHVSAEAAALEAAKASAAKREECKAKAAALQEFEAEVAATDAYFTKLEYAKEQIASRRALIRGRKEALEAALAALDSFEAGELQDAPVDVVMKQLKDPRADPVMLLAAPHALKLKPSDRRPFDEVTVQEVREVLAQKAAAAAERLEEGSEEEAEATAEALGAWAILDCMKERELSIQLELQTANGDMQSAEAAEMVAKAAMETRRAARSGALVQQALYEERLRNLDAAVAAFGRIANPTVPEQPEDVSMQPCEEVYGIADVPKVADIPVPALIPSPARIGA